MSLAAQFFQEYVTFEPEDASALGYHEADGSLKDISPSALLREEAFYRNMLQQLDSVADPTPETAADLIVMRSFCIYKLHYFEIQKYQWNIWLSAYPYKTVLSQAVRATSATAWMAVCDRLSAMPTFLMSQEDNLKAGIVNGRVPHALEFEEVLNGIRNNVLSDTDSGSASDLSLTKELTSRLRENIDNTPTAERVLDSLRSACKIAEATYSLHVKFLEEVVAPHACPNMSFALGRTEYEWRLKYIFGLEDSPEILVANAKRELVDIQAQMETKLSTILGRQINGTESLRDAMNELRRTKESMRPSRQSSGALDAAEADRTIACYDGQVHRAIRFAELRNLISQRDDYALVVREMPRGLSSPAPVANWSALLMDPESKGYFVVDFQRSMPGGLSAAISVHEGVPGHYLQSLAWQRQFGSNKAPVQFIQSGDEVSMASGFWGPSLNIEGWAHYAERVMIDEGFYDQGSAEEIEALSAQSLRLVRVILDCQLHALGGTIEDAAVTLYELGLEASSLKEAKDEVVGRYALLPTQAMTYAIGRAQIQRLRDDWIKASPTQTAASFHAAFLGFGPLPPERIRSLMGL